MAEETAGARGDMCSIHQQSIAKQTSDMLAEVRSAETENAPYSVPLTELAALGAGVASLLRIFPTQTQASADTAFCLYRLTNASAGETLKLAKDGNFWGALKRPDGTSKFAKFEAVDRMPQSGSGNLPVDPITLLMAVMLYSVEQKLGKIEQLQRQIGAFLETEKESEIEADIETLTDMIEKYKYNWDNPQYLQSSHKMVLDLQRTARKNMLTYQKRVAEGLKGSRQFVAQARVTSTLNDLLKKFRYYRLSLYTFSLASLLEILLSGNFQEEYISGVKAEIDARAMNYRDLFGACSGYLEKLGSTALETKAMKGMGTASEAVGKFIGMIPKIKDGQVDERLQEQGARLKDDAERRNRQTLLAFAEISNPETGVFSEKMQELIQIYNHTAEICVDAKRLYLLTE